MNLWLPRRRVVSAALQGEGIALPDVAFKIWSDCLQYSVLKLLEVLSRRICGSAHAVLSEHKLCAAACTPQLLNVHNDLCR